MNSVTILQQCFLEHILVSHEKLDTSFTIDSTNLKQQDICVKVSVLGNH